MIRSSKMARAGLFALALVAVAGDVEAQIYVGNTAVPGAQTFNRANQGCTNLAFSGTNVPYNSQAFFTGTAGEYSFISIQQTPADWDHFLFLYAGSFDPSDALTNCVADSDGILPDVPPQFSLALTANTQYFLVTTGFLDADVGSFQNQVTGPALVTFGTVPTDLPSDPPTNVDNPPTNVVPEPSTYALMATGLAGLVGVSRRRRTR